MIRRDYHTGDEALIYFKRQRFSPKNGMIPKIPPCHTHHITSKTSLYRWPSIESRSVISRQTTTLIKGRGFSHLDVSLVGVTRWLVRLVRSHGFVSWIWCIFPYLFGYPQATWEPFFPWKKHITKVDSGRPGPVSWEDGTIDSNSKLSKLQPRFVTNLNGTILVTCLKKDLQNYCCRK